MAAELCEVPTDVYRCGDHYVVQCDLPGVDPASLDVSVQGNVVTVHAHRTDGAESGVRWLARERPTGTISREVRLDEPVQGRNIGATYHDGVLTLSVSPASPDAGHAEGHRWSVHVLHGLPA